MLSGLYRIRHRNAPAPYTKYLQFFEVSAYTALSKTVIVDTLNVWILGSVASNRDRPRIHLLPIGLYQKKWHRLRRCQVLRTKCPEVLRFSSHSSNLRDARRRSRHCAHGRASCSTSP